MQLAGVDDSTDRFAGLAVSDAKKRVWVGRTADGTAAIVLSDGAGRKRIVMQAPSAGAASLEFLDENGRIVERLVPASK